MSKDEPLVAPRLRPVIHFLGVLRKEAVAILRQPRLLLILVIGPFLVLALFAVGFDQERTVLDTTFVGPRDSVYESSIEEFADELDRYVRFNGYTTDLVAAERALDRGDTDLIVIFPSDPVASVLAGEQAEIKILHDKIDPIQQTTVEVSAQVAVQELNARLLQEVVGEAQRLLVPYEQSLEDASTSIEDLRTAVSAGDDEAVRAATSELLDSSNALTTIVEVSDEFASRMDGSSEGTYGDLTTSSTELERLVADAVVSDRHLDEFGQVPRVRLDVDHPARVVAEDAEQVGDPHVDRRRLDERVIQRFDDDASSIELLAKGPVRQDHVSDVTAASGGDDRELLDEVGSLGQDLLDVGEDGLVSDCTDAFQEVAADPSSAAAGGDSDRETDEQRDQQAGEQTAEDHQAGKRDPVQAGGVDQQRVSVELEEATEDGDDEQPERTDHSDERDQSLQRSHRCPPPRARGGRASRVLGGRGQSRRQIG